MIEGPGPVLVTGTSSGIGRAITELLSSNGRIVYATARKDADLAALARLPNVTPIRVDVTHDEDVQKAVEGIREVGTGLYGLVNNAGISGFGPLLDNSVRAMLRVLDVNLFGMHRMVRACFPFLRESHGRVVNISSIAGILTGGFLGTYVISKHAVESYSDTLREELSPFGIHVSLIEPGDFRSNIVINAFARRGPEEAAARWSNSLYREAVLPALAEMTKSPEHLARLDYPEPRPVAEAVSDALFSQEPKPRYLVANQDETSEVVTKVLNLLSQLNQRHDHSLTKAELTERLESILP